MSTLGYTYSDAAAVPTTTTAHTAAATAAGVRPQRPGAAAAGVGGGRGRAALRPGSRVCWMLFEYCDKGVLGVRVEKVEYLWYFMCCVVLHALQLNQQLKPLCYVPHVCMLCYSVTIII
jgi:hypothetical protein